MGRAVRRLHGAVVVVMTCWALTSCGPRVLSALGNPGDYCTEDSACGDGTSCRPVEDGFRCTGNAEAEQASRERRARPQDGPVVIAGEAGESLGPLPSTIDVESSSGDAEPMDFGSQAGINVDESAEGYVPPSRRRGGGR